MTGEISNIFAYIGNGEICRKIAEILAPTRDLSRNKNTYYMLWCKYRAR